MQKVISFLFTLFIFVAASSAQQIEKLFDKYMEDKRFNYIYKKGSNEADQLSPLIVPKKLSARTLENEKMLILNSADINFKKKFSEEVERALNTDKFENISYVRNGKANRVREYIRKSSSIYEEVNIIENEDNHFLLICKTYSIKQKNE